jgi:hypothetical protein
MGLDVVRRRTQMPRSDAMRSVRGSLAGEHRVAHVRSIAVRAPHVDAAEAREELLRVAARDHEADALVGDAPDARRRRAWVEAQLGLQPWRAAGRQPRARTTTSTSN